MQSAHKQSEQIHEIPSSKLHHSHSLIQPLPSGNSLKIQQLFHIPDLKTNKSYQNTVKNIIHLMHQFDRFTDNLQQKVDNLLAAQKNEFVDSYKQHMRRIQAQYRCLQQQVQRQQQQINYYQNQGKMSNLIKKVAKLEQQSKKLYELMNKKQKQIKQLELQNKVQKQENKRLYVQVKELLKNKNQTKNKLESYQKNREFYSSQLNGNQNQYKEKFFPTEINQLRSIKKDLSITTDQHKKVPAFSYNVSEHSINYLNNQQQQSEHPSNSYKNQQLKKQLQNLTLKNRKLTKFNSKVLFQKNELQNIFINSVYEIKKQITIKKKIKQCTYEDFTKQDKVNLLLTIISNQEILRYVYERIFGKGAYMKSEIKETREINGNQLGMTKGISVNTNLHVRKNMIRTPNTSKLPYI